MALPNKGRATGRDGARALWFGQHALLVGPKPDKKLTEFGILTDQSDAWVILRMSGGSIEDVLMRLSPIDVRLKAFKSGDVVRTSLMHQTGTNNVTTFKCFQSYINWT